MAHINVSSASKFASVRNSVAWGKLNTCKNNLKGSGNVLLFGAVLIVCSIAVGCSSDKPKTVIIAAPVVPTTTAMSNPLPTPSTETAPKPVPKKIVHRRPTTLTYTDKTSGVSFDYSRKDNLKTGDDASKLVNSIPMPMNFVQPGGVALAAVELPGASYNSNDLAAAFFNVSVNRTLTAEQCDEFRDPKPSPATAKTDASTPGDPAMQISNPPMPTTKLILGDLDLQGTEAVSGEGIRQSDAKYFHVFQNGACYEFAVNVTTSAPDSQLALKHVDREKAFQQLEKILATVKVETIAAPEVAVSTPAPATSTETKNQTTPAQ